MTRTSHTGASLPDDLSEMTIGAKVGHVESRYVVVGEEEGIYFAVVPLICDGFGEHERRGKGGYVAGGAIGREVLAISTASDGPGLC